jgi:hypothetical protein
MREALIKYYEIEYSRLKNLLQTKNSWVNPKEAVDNAIQRCLGVADFIRLTLDQSLSYEELISIVDEVEQKMINLKENS